MGPNYALLMGLWVLALGALVLLVSGSAKETHENPYLTHNNVTVCPGHWEATGYQPCGGPRHGACFIKEAECHCNQGYRGPDCSYALRSRRTAFILSFLLGNWGAGELYLGLIGVGVLQLLLYTFLLILPCFPLCCMCVTSDASKLQRYYRFLVLLSVIGMLGVLALWTADWLYILLDASDAYSLPLQDDFRLASASGPALLKDVL